MSKLKAPMVSRITGRSKSGSTFAEGVSVPKEAWAAEVRKNPALESKNKAERTQATRQAILKGNLAKYRMR